MKDILKITVSLHGRTVCGLLSIKRFDINKGHRIHTLTAAALLQSRFPHSGHRLRESPCPNRLSYSRSGTGGADVSQDGVQYCMCQQRRSRQEFQFFLRKRQMDTCSRVRHYLFPGGDQRRTYNICQIFGQSKP